MLQLISKSVLTVFFSFSFFMVFGQQVYVNKDWNTINGNTGPVQIVKSLVDPDGNLVYLSNKKISNQRTDIFLNCIHPNGNVAWEKTCTNLNSGMEFGKDIKIDDLGNIYLLGSSYNGTDNDLFIAKYGQNGILEFQNTFNSGFNDVPASLAIDQNGNMFIAGTREGISNKEVVVVKFDIDGIVSWSNVFGLPNTDLDSRKILLSSSNEVIVCCQLEDNVSSISDVSMVKFDNNGIQVAFQSLNSTSTDSYIYEDCVMDDSGNLFLISTSINNQVKFEAIDGNFVGIWSNFIPNFSGVGVALALSNQTSVCYLANSTNNSADSFLQIGMVDKNSGNELWSHNKFVFKNYNSIHGVGVNNLDDKIILYSDINTTTGSDLLTTCYSANGDVLWEERYAQNDVSNDIPKSVAQYGDKVYVTGTSQVGSSTEINTVRYSHKEKISNYEYDQNGDPMFESNELVISFATDILNMNVIDNKGIRYGTIEDFLSSQSVFQIKEAIDDICDEKCDINVYKVYTDFTSNIQFTKNRLNKTIPVPKFWSTLLVEFPDGVDIAQVKPRLEQLTSIIKAVDPNPVIVPLNSPNDPLYTLQYNLESSNSPFPNSDINVEGAWDMEVGKRHVRVGVYDSGIEWQHEDFGTGVPSGSKIVDGYNFTVGAQPMYSDPSHSSDPHGTQSAGVIGAIRNNNIGVSGIAGGSNSGTFNLDSTGVSIYSMRLTPPHPLYFTLSNVYQAIVGGALDDSDTSLYYAFGLNIMNNSWRIHPGSGPYFSDSSITNLTLATHFVNRANVTFVAARGNEGENNLAYPAKIDDDWILCVGGTGEDGQFINSNAGNGIFTASSGWEVDVAAPANFTQIHSTYTPNTYAAYSGTSAATPHVTGVAALLMSYHNDSLPHVDNLSPEDVEWLLQLSAVDTDYPGVDSLTGYGRVDATKAVEYLDTAKYTLSHFSNVLNNGSVNVTQIGTNDTIELKEHYRDVNDQWFLDFSRYVVNTYQVNSSVFHPIPIQDSIIYFWPRPSSSNLFEPVVNGVLLPRERVYINSLGNLSANISGYAYEVFDTLGTHLGWWPINPFIEQPELSYTVLYQKEETLKLDDFENNFNIQCYPNPSIDKNITISINSGVNTRSEIRWVDIQGRSVGESRNVNLYNGKNDFSFNMSNYTAGIYVCIIKIGEDQFYEKVVIH